MNEYIKGMVTLKEHLFAIKYNDHIDGMYECMHTAVKMLLLSNIFKAYCTLLLRLILNNISNVT